MQAHRPRCRRRWPRLLRDKHLATSTTQHWHEWVRRRMDELRQHSKGLHRDYNNKSRHLEVFPKLACSAIPPDLKKQKQIPQQKTRIAQENARSRHCSSGNPVLWTGLARTSQKRPKSKTSVFFQKIVGPIQSQDKRFSSSARTCNPYPP